MDREVKKDGQDTVTSGALAREARLRSTMDHMYWIDEKEIYKANKFTGKNVTVLVKDAFSPKDLHIYHPQRQPQASPPVTETTTPLSPVSVNYTSNPSVNIVDKQSGSDESKPNFGLIFGILAGVFVVIVTVCVVLIVIARKKRSPRLQIVYTVDNETTNDKAMIVNSKQSKRAVIFKGNINRDFDNINYDDQKTEEYDEDDDERRPVIPLSDGDIV